MKQLKIEEGIFIVGGPDITDGRDGCIYLINLGELILVDTGAGWSVDKIINNIKGLALDCKNLTRILLTHCHIDHIGGAPEIKRRFGSKIYIHKLDAPPLENGDPVLTAANWYQTSFPPTPADVKFNLPEEILAIDEQKIVCLHTPGHTPGSISLLLEKEKLVIVGDVLSNTAGLSLPSKAFTIDLKQEIQSIKKVASLDVNYICFGHGLTLTHTAHQTVMDFASKFATAGMGHERDK